MTDILVFDVGGSHISSCVFSTSDSSFDALQTALIPNLCGLDEFVATIASLGKHANAKREAIAGASFAMPGPFDYVQGISAMKHKFQGLFGIPLASHLANALGCVEDQISFLNDAAAFMMGEVSLGAAAGAHRAICITLGTGIGSAFAVDGELVITGEGVPDGGEIWNFPYRGEILENLISTATLQRSYEQRSGRRIEVREIAKLAVGEQEARETFAKFGTNLGQALRDICGPFHPDCIVLGGGIARSAPLFLPAAEKELAGLSVRLCIAELGDYAPLIGAGVYWRKTRLPYAHALQM